MLHLIQSVEKLELFHLSSLISSKIRQNLTVENVLNYIQIDSSNNEILQHFNWSVQVLFI